MLITCCDKQKHEKRKTPNSKYYSHNVASMYNSPHHRGSTKSSKGSMSTLPVEMGRELSGRKDDLNDKDFTSGRESLDFERSDASQWGTGRVSGGDGLSAVSMSDTTTCYVISGRR